MENEKIIKKIDILLPLAESNLPHHLIDLKEAFKRTKEIIPSMLEHYKEIENNVSVSFEFMLFEVF